MHRYQIDIFREQELIRLKHSKFSITIGSYLEGRGNRRFLEVDRMMQCASAFQRCILLG